MERMKESMASRRWLGGKWERVGRSWKTRPGQNSMMKKVAPITEGSSQLWLPGAGEKDTRGQQFVHIHGIRCPLLAKEPVMLAYGSDYLQSINLGHGYSRVKVADRLQNAVLALDLVSRGNQQFSRRLPLDNVFVARCFISD